MSLAPQVGRAQAGGAPDSSFGQYGKQLLPVPSVSSPGSSFSLGGGRQLSNGKIVTAVTAVIGNQWYVGIARYLPTGALDSSFGTNGYTLSGLTSYNNMMAAFDPLLMQPDGKFLVVGSSKLTAGSGPYAFGIYRFLSTGQPDSAFGTQGKRLIVPGSTSSTLVGALLQPQDGKIILYGNTGTNTGNNHGVLTRLMPDGSTDGSFGTNGVAEIPDTNTYRILSAMALQATGKMVGLLNGYSSTGSPSIITRFTAAGVLDGSFGVNGVAVTSVAGTPFYPQHLAVKADDKIVALHATNNPPNTTTPFALIVQYGPDGVLDPGFGAGGRATVAAGTFYSPSPTRVAMQPSDGKILVTGYGASGSNADPVFVLARLQATGTLDPDFGTGGVVTTGFTGRRALADALQLLPDEKIFVSGSCVGYPTVDPAPLGCARYYSCGKPALSPLGNVTASTGQAASFVAAAVQQTAQFQWQVEGATGWQTLQDGGPYSGTQTATLTISNLTVANDGMRFRAAARTGTCTDTTAAARLIVLPLSVAGETLYPLQVHPNPVAGVLCLEASEALQGMAYRVHNTSGRVVRQGRLLAGRQTIDAAGFPAGVYLITVGDRRIPFVKE